MLRPADNNESPDLPDTDFEFLADSEVIAADGLRTILHDRENLTTASSIRRSEQSPPIR